MKRNKSSVSKVSSYKDIAEYWDVHDLSKVWDKTRKVKFDVHIENEAIYYAEEKSPPERFNRLPKRRAYLRILSLIFGSGRNFKNTLFNKPHSPKPGHPELKGKD